MKEQGQFERKVERPTLESLDNVSGREIEGLEEKPEKFLPLKEGEDFIVIEKNQHVSSDKNFEDFIVFVSPSIGTETKIVEAPHWRAINDNNVHSVVTITDAKGMQHVSHFYAVSTKGIGYLKPTAKGLNIEDYDSWAVKDKEGVNDRGYKVLGLISEEEATGGALVEKSEKLLALGLRTEVYWGMAELKKLPFKGKMMTVDELRNEKVISPRKDYKPFEVVRLFKMNNRIAEASESDERRKDLFARAFDIFNQETRDRGLLFPELVIGNPEHEKIFFTEFFKRMGQNIATLLNIGYDHGYMHSANVTLAAEIADVGTIDHWENQKDEDNLKKYAGVRRGHLKDMRDVCYGFRMLMKAARRNKLEVGSNEELKKAFFDGFNGIFDETLVKKEETNPKNAKIWMEKIFDTVIVRGDNLPSLMHNEVEDWDISVK